MLYLLLLLLPSVTSLVASNLPSVILAIILLLSVEMVVIILTVCLCLLQRSRTDKLVRRETVSQYLLTLLEHHAVVSRGSAPGTRRGRRWRGRRGPCRWSTGGQGGGGG